MQPKVTGHNVGSEEPEEKKRVPEAGIDASPAMPSEAVPCEATQHATTQPSPKAVQCMSLGLSTKFKVWEGSKGVTIQSQAHAFDVIELATTSEAAPPETTKPSPGATQGKAKEHSAMQLSATLLAKVWVSGLLAETTQRTVQALCKSFGVFCRS